MEELTTETFALDFEVQESLHGALCIHSEKPVFFGVTIAEKACSAKVLSEIGNTTYKNGRNHHWHSIAGFWDSAKHKFFGVDGDSAFIDPCNRQNYTFFATQSERGAH